jgi:membrane protease YdiL (CAAX protease family)
VQEFLEYASRGKNAWWRYILACVGAFPIAVIVTLGAVAGLSVLGVPTFRMIAELRHPSSGTNFLLAAGFAFGTQLIAFAISVAVVQRKSPGDMVGRWHWSLFGFGAVLWLAFSCLSTLLDFLIEPRGFRFSMSGATPLFALGALATLFIQTFTEEFIFRGYLTQGILLALKRPLPAAIVSGLLFGSLHIPNGFPQAVNAVFFGTICSLIAIRTGGIALTFGVHLVNNWFGAVVDVSADDVFKGSAGIFTQNTPNLDWSDVAASVVGLIVLLWLVSRTQNAPERHSIPVAESS